MVNLSYQYQILKQITALENDFNRNKGNMLLPPFEDLVDEIKLFNYNYHVIKWEQNNQGYEGC